MTKLTVRLWTGLVCLVLASVSLEARRDPLKRKLAELFSERFAFRAGGVPAVTVGVMDGQREVSFGVAAGGVARIYQKDGSPRRVLLRKGKTYKLRLLRSTPASLKFWIVAFSVPRSQSKRWPRLVTAWKRRGFAIKSLALGSVYSVRGKLFDTRRRLGAIAQFSSLAKARRKRQQLIRRFSMPFKIHTQLLKRPSASFVLSGNGGSWSGRSLVEIQATRGSIRVDRVEFGRGYSWHTFRTRLYRGKLLLTVDQKGAISVVNQIALPRFLQGVLRAEMPASAPLEALKAQAICARNEVLSKIGTRHRADPYLFCAHTHCQVYTGKPHRRKNRIAEAIRQTRGMVMTTRSGQIIDAPFSALCGGHTEHNEHVWAQVPRSALRGKSDAQGSSPSPIASSALKQWLTQPQRAYCQSGSRTARRKFRWQRNIAASALDSLVQKKYPIGAVKQIKVLRRGVSGRAYLLQITGAKKTVKIQGELNIRRLFGGLNSSMFLVRKLVGDDGKFVGWNFTGGGWGHGVGMCQYGAMARAKAGQSYKAILKHYYTGIRLRRLY